LDDLTAEERSLLDGLGFDADAFEGLAARVRAGTVPSNTAQGTVEPPREGAILPLAPMGTMQGDALRDAGLQLLGTGRAAIVVLNGGMATRFGGRVKGVVEALPGRSFLSLQASRLQAANAPLFVMNSRATEEATQAHLDTLGLDLDILCFTQSGAPRLNPDGSLFRDGEGALSIYGPGHGDLVPSLRRSGALADARERGIEYLLMANVDNLGASLDPALLGRFAASGADMMVEVAPKQAGDRGGAPARVDGRLKILEEFAFPPDFDQDRIRVFNTNTLWFRTEALDVDFPMRWYVVHKEADGRPVVQFERLVGQLSWFLDTEWVRVPRSRFLPVKTPADLDLVAPDLKRMFGTSLRVL
jgi:UTP--glucose-1-phosphate uridylyltransferase